MNSSTRFMTAALAAFSGLAVQAVELGAPFKDNMVLQRGIPVNVWGTASAGEAVSVSFAGANVSTNADASGKWIVTLPPLPASREPRVLTAGDRTISNVLVGEVWIASGQSNMVVPLDGDSNRFRDQDGRLLAARTRRADVRLMTTPSATASSEKSGWGSSVVAWESVDPDNAAQLGFSAIGWRFAVGLRDALDVPVGVIFNAWNGSRIEGWIPAEGYAAVGLDPADATQVYDAGGYGTPKSIWNGKVCPLAPMTVRGFLWYQGESNCSTAGYGENKLGGIPQYAQLLKALYEGWKVRFGNPELKMVFAGLATWGNGNEYLMNEEQQKFADAEPNAAMAVINDIGIVGDIHGSDKARTAERMISLALQHAYGRDLKADSPRCRSAVANGATVTLGFDNVEGLRLWSMREVALTTNFQLAGEDGAFYDAAIQNFQVYTNESGSTLLSKGNIVGDTIRLKSDKVAAPRYVRYLHNSGRMGNIFNERSLPLAAFTAEIDPSEVFDLTGDTTVDVPAGTVRRLGLIGGGDYTLTKTGEGELVVSGATNAALKVVVAGGTVSVAEKAAPDVLRDAVFHVDASCAATLTYAAADGTNFVSRWNDRRSLASERIGETYDMYAYNTMDRYKPFIRAAFQNGRDVMDFGTLHPGITAGATDPETGARVGWGGYMHWNREVATIRDVFTVVCEDPEVKYANNRNPSQNTYLAPPFVGDSASQSSDRYNWMRNLFTSAYANSSKISNSEILRGFDGDIYTDRVKSGSIYLDGRPVKYTARFPDGFHLLEFQPTNDTKGNAFAKMGWQCQGGQRIAEFIVFDRRLDEAERLRVQEYLMSKWLPVRVKSLTLAAGTTLSLPANTSLEAGSLAMADTARVSGEGVLTAGNADTVRADGPVTLGANGDEETSRYAFAGDAVLDVPRKVRTDLITGDGALVKCGAGELTAVDLGEGITALDVREGALRVRPLLNRDAILHVDASMPDTSSVLRQNGTNYVTTWVDVNHRDLRAYSTSANRPFRRRAFQNGRDIIDLGSLANKLIDNPAGYGANFDWKPSAVSNIREVFTVASDTPDAYEIVDKYGKVDILSMYFVGESPGDPLKWQFIRPMFSIASSGRSTQLVREFNSGYSEPVIKGVTLYDGVSVRPHTTVMGPGFHVLNFQAIGDCYGDSFGKASGQSTGGQRIGEFMIFTNTLDAVTRAKINGTLMGKWLDSTNVYDWAFANVAVAAGASLDLEGQGLAVSGRLAVAGRISAQRVSAGRFAFADGAEIDAALVLPDGAKLDVSGSRATGFNQLKAKRIVFAGTGTIGVSYDSLAELIAGKSVCVMTADEAIVGNPSKWTLNAGQKQVFSARLFLGEDGKSVYAVFGKRGMQLIFR